jgi:ABC-2 type transport system ATP-binding protein
MIVGLIAASTGEILFNGIPIQQDPIQYKTRIGYVPEERYLYSHLSGLEYLMMVVLRKRPCPRSMPCRFIVNNSH